MLFFQVHWSLLEGHLRYNLLPPCPWKHRLNPPFSEFRFLSSSCRLCTSLHGRPNRDLIKLSLTVRSQSNFCLCFFGQKENLFCYVLGFRGGRYGLWRAVTLHPPSLLNLRRSLVGLTAQAGWDPRPDAACPLCTRPAPKWKAGSVRQRLCWLFTGKVGFITVIYELLASWYRDVLFMLCSSSAWLYHHKGNYNHACPGKQ